MLRVLATFAFLLLLPGRAEADPVAVRHPEGDVYGVLALSSTAGEVLAHGELIQALRGRQVESQLVFRFKDGSLHDERVVFGQQKVFSLIRYHLIQRGPAFPSRIEVSFDRGSGQYRARFREKPDREEEILEGRLEMPADLYNGLTSVLLKNLRVGETATGHIVAFTPKPRLVKMEIGAEGKDGFLVGSITRTAIRYLVKLELGGMLGVVATIVGKDPPDLRYWVVAEPVPAFVKFEGPFYLNGPVWRIELTGPRWPGSSPRPK